MARQRKNIAASVRARLLAFSRKHGQEFQSVLTRFALERLLYRLGRSRHADRFVLKGAMLMTVWFDRPHRPTKDLDLLGYGDPTSATVLDMFREIMDTDERDGIAFDADGARIGEIRAGGEYGGLRVRTNAFVDAARILVSVDVGFGDVTVPPARIHDYPVLLDDLPAPRLRAYAPETVVSEKFHAVVLQGFGNTRMKDYFDLWTLDRWGGLDDERLARAIAATFARRRTPIPDETPVGLSAEFSTASEKRAQWAAFAKRIASDPGPLPEVVAALERFLMPAARAARAVPPPPEG